MTCFLDANVLIRYLTGAPGDQALGARTLIESDASLVVTAVALLETCCVLDKVYRVPRDILVDTVTQVILRHNITTADADKAHTAAGLGFCRGSGRVSYGDALIWASARTCRPARVYSFDQRFPEDEIEVEAP